jgi:mediator of RNA polymerase II transcription subunit 12
MAELPASENRAGGGDGASTSKPASPPPFPAQPFNNTRANIAQNAGAKAPEDIPDTKVQTTPYRIETPAAAPKLKGDSKLSFQL